MRVNLQFRYILASFMTVGGVVLGTSVIYAQSVTTTPPPSVTTTPPPSTTPGANQATMLANIKARADSEISKRLTSLNSALSKINGATKLSSTDKSTFSAQIQADITNLTALKTKIDADTDLTTLKNDAKSIYTSFRVYAVFIPQVHQLAAVDTMGVTAGNLLTLSTKLQARIQTVQQSGKDVSSLLTLLSDLNAKVADSKVQYQAIESEIASLTPSSYPGSNSILQDARAKLKTGTTDLQTAWQDAKQIVQGLKAFGTQGSNSSPSATITGTH